MNVATPVATAPTMHPVVQPTVVQPTTITMNPMAGQLIQMPNCSCCSCCQLFMLPSNTYLGAQPVTLQAVQPVGVTNEAFKKPVMIQ